ncbi:hypothetical protein RB620_29395 [Paenibacillus sp. LHD-117]|uniref:hypothetical protein n=1 Tax=Paenibacillus sp. LHD-117 TaxID=3071412 RepID=UPI0027E05B6F|nr:hypothetical protein [Paenibacillus sp. LHD-117]MDQ6423531.1 hypothetical protein [Paenibacillus sp. LHD-117]
MYVISPNAQLRREYSCGCELSSATSGSFSIIPANDFLVERLRREYSCEYASFLRQWREKWLLPNEIAARSQQSVREPGQTGKIDAQIRLLRNTKTSINHRVNMV